MIFIFNKNEIGLTVARVNLQQETGRHRRPHLISEKRSVPQYGFNIKRRQVMTDSNFFQNLVARPIDGLCGLRPMIRSNLSKSETHCSGVLNQDVLNGKLQVLFYVTAIFIEGPLLLTQLYIPPPFRPKEPCFGRICNDFGKESIFLWKTSVKKLFLVLGRIHDIKATSDIFSKLPVPATGGGQ